MDVSVGTHHERFEEYCRAKFSTDASGEKNTSKAIWKEKGSRILNVLKGDPAAQDYSATFKFWVKKRKFQVMSYSPSSWPNRCTLPSS